MHPGRNPVVLNTLLCHLIVYDADTNKTVSNCRRLMPSVMSKLRERVDEFKTEEATWDLPPALSASTIQHGPSKTRGYENISEIRGGLLRLLKHNGINPKQKKDLQLNYQEAPAHRIVLVVKGEVKTLLGPLIANVQDWIHGHSRDTRAVPTWHAQGGWD